jgi:hypothetical protein
MEAMWSIQSLDLSDRGNQFVRFMKEGQRAKSDHTMHSQEDCWQSFSRWGRRMLVRPRCSTRSILIQRRMSLLMAVLRTTISDAYRRLRLVWPVSSITWT